VAKRSAIAIRNSGLINRSNFLKGLLYETHFCTLSKMVGFWAASGIANANKAKANKSFGFPSLKLIFLLVFQFVPGS
jgi:hypothetical protein